MASGGPTSTQGHHRVSKDGRGLYDWLMHMHAFCLHPQKHVELFSQWKLKYIALCIKPYYWRNSVEKIRDCIDFCPMRVLELNLTRPRYPCEMNEACKMSAPVFYLKFPVIPNLAHFKHLRKQCKNVLDNQSRKWNVSNSLPFEP